MTPEKLRDVARDAESDTHSAIWNYPTVLRDAADEIERLQARLSAFERYSNGYIKAQVEAHLKELES